MANEQNLIPGAHPLTVEEQSKGGKASGKARRHKADLRKIAQQVLDGTYRDKNTGIEMTGEELILNGIVANLSPNSRNWGKAMDVLIELLGADKSREEKQHLKAQTALIKAKTGLITNEDTSALDKLDGILREMRSNAEHTDTESEAE